MFNYSQNVFSSCCRKDINQAIRCSLVVRKFGSLGSNLIITKKKEKEKIYVIFFAMSFPHFEGINIYPSLIAFFFLGVIS